MISRPNPLRLFLWGFVKDEVYVPAVPTTLNNLMDGIRREAVKSDQRLLKNIWHKVEYGLDVCKTTNGAHTELA
jgi:hypothetical protein